MKFVYTRYTNVTVIEYDGAVDLAHPPDPDTIPANQQRHLVLTPRVYKGRNVLAAYDEPSDTLYIRVQDGDL